MMTMSLGDQIYTHPREIIPIDIKSPLNGANTKPQGAYTKGEFKNVF